MLKELEGTGFRGGFILELASMADMQQMLVEAMGLNLWQQIAP